MMYNISDKAIAVYGKQEGVLKFFKIYEFEEKEQARKDFVKLIDDKNVDQYFMMAIEELSLALDLLTESG